MVWFERQPRASPTLKYKRNQPHQAGSTRVASSAQLRSWTQCNANNSSRLGSCSLVAYAFKLWTHSVFIVGESWLTPFLGERRHPYLYPDVATSTFYFLRVWWQPVVRLTRHAWPLPLTHLAIVSIVYVLCQENKSFVYSLVAVLLQGVFDQKHLPTKLKQVQTICRQLVAFIEED